MSYNGWKNYETWNVSLWINNDETLYRALVDYTLTARSGEASYKGLVAHVNLVRTPDGVDYISDELDYAHLDEMVQEVNS